jgi:hypothetical protein
MRIVSRRDARRRDAQRAALSNLKRNDGAGARVYQPITNFAGKK